MKKYLLFLLFLLLPLMVFAEDISKNYELEITNTEFNINEYFSLTNINNWNVSDPSVASIVDGIIVPIKAGTTTITTTVTTSTSNNTYTLNLEVVNPEKKVINTNKDINQVMQDVDVKNPKTGDALILLIMIISLSLVTSVFISIIMKNNKYEEE